MPSDKIRDVLIASKEVKKAIIERAEKYDLPLSLICKDFGINWTEFRLVYLNTQSVDYDKIKFTQEQLIGVLATLGIKVKVNLILSEIDGDKIKSDLKKKYQWKERK